CQGPREGLRLLRARHAVLPVDDEERDAADAVLGGLPLIGAHRLEVLPRVERARRGLAVEPDLRGQPDELLGPAEMTALLEVGAQQALLHLGLAPLRLREVE